MGMYLLQYRNKLLAAVFVVLVAIAAFLFGRSTVTPERAAGVYRMDDQVASLLRQGTVTGPPQTAQRETASELVPATPPPLPSAEADRSGSVSAGQPAQAAQAAQATQAAQAEQTPAPSAAAPALAAPTASAGRLDGRIDLNTASLEQLMELPRIGEAKAQAIIAYREENGGFRSADEIVNVKGIGDKTYESFRDQITASLH